MTSPLRRHGRGGFSYAPLAPDVIGSTHPRSRNLLRSVDLHESQRECHIFSHGQLRKKLTELPKFVRLLAEYSGQLVNYSQLASGINVNHRTGQRYVGLLEQVFLIATLQPWFKNSN